MKRQKDRKKDEDKRRQKRQNIIDNVQYGIQTQNRKIKLLKNGKRGSAV